MRYVSLLIRLSNKGRLGIPLDVSLESLHPRTHPLIREVLTHLMNLQIRPLSPHKEPKLHKRADHLKIDLILVL